MSNEILSVLEYMEKEKGISREDMISTIAGAIKNAAQKGVIAGAEIEVQIDPRTGALKAWTLLNVVDSFSDPATEIPIDKAQLLSKEAKVGDVLKKEIDPAELGRIAAQAARQGIMQRVRQFEKDRIYDDYKDSVGDIVTGVVRRRERGDLIVDLGKAEAVLPPRERVPGEDYAPGERIRCLLLAIDSTPRGPELILSRASIKFVRRLFELEVTEIADGTVSLEGMAREPGYRTKICVHSNDPKVDPVGACVGARGARVKSIVRELGGEKIDIIRYHADPQLMLEEAIKPAVPKNIEIDPASKRIYFEVDEEGLPTAIGRRGQNAKLTSKLMGWRLDIGKEKREAATLEERAERAGHHLAQALGISEDLAEKLVGMGINSVEVIAAGVTAEDLVESGSFTAEEAAEIIAKFNQLQA